jgi:hypothetical protein
MKFKVQCQNIKNDYAELKYAGKAFQIVGAAIRNARDAIAVLILPGTISKFELNECNVLDL